MCIFSRWGAGGYAKFNALKAHNKELKTLLAIGGWNEASNRFSKLVADPDMRHNLVKSSISYLRQHKFDGLDLDWEYPSSRDGSDPADRSNYALLVKVCHYLIQYPIKRTNTETIPCSQHVCIVRKAVAIRFFFWILMINFSFPQGIARRFR